MSITNIKCKLTEKDGNAFAVMGEVKRALRKGGRGDLCDEFLDKAMSGDYNDLLCIAMEYVEVS